jgi:peptide/nickel transport system permease protein
MARFFLRRLTLGILTLFTISLFVFVGTEMLPGDVASAILGQDRTPEAEQAIRLALGLNLPPYTRYLTWLQQFVHGDMGRSLTNGRDIAAEVVWRLKNTLFLAGIVACVVAPLAVLLGVLSAGLRNSVWDRAINIIALGCISLPDFFVGYFLIVLLSVKFRWFPSLSVIDPSMPFHEKMYVVVLPAMTLGLGILAYIMRLTRVAIIDVFNRPYIEMALLNGTPRWRIVWQHALPNALAPIINVVASNLAHLVVATVIVEVIFVYPGIGQLMVDAVQKRDLPMVQACGLIFAAVYVAVNLTADFLVILSNPRLRRST